MCIPTFLAGLDKKHRHRLASSYLITEWALLSRPSSGCLPSSVFRYMQKSSTNTFRTIRTSFYAFSQFADKYAKYFPSFLATVILLACKNSLDGRSKADQCDTDSLSTFTDSLDDITARTAEEDPPPKLAGWWEGKYFKETQQSVLPPAIAFELPSYSQATHSEYPTTAHLKLDYVARMSKCCSICLESYGFHAKHAAHLGQSRLRAYPIQKPCHLRHRAMPSLPTLSRWIFFGISAPFVHYAGQAIPSLR